MSGKVQHEIPRLFQRGFLIPDTGNAERIYVFRRDRSFPSNISQSGAESYFYSKPTDDGSKTLDDDVTAYEGRLGRLVQELRAAAVGEIVDARVAAEVIAHLTTRNAHLRGTFVHGIRTLAKSAVELFGDEENRRRLIGADTPWVSDLFRERIVKEFLKNPQIAALNIPPVLFERWTYSVVREGYTSFFKGHLPEIKAQFDLMLARAPTSIRDAHNKALEQSVVPEVRVDNLTPFVWRKVDVGTDLVLPDCVALAVEADGSIHPLMMADMDNTQTVLLPLSTRSLLVGSKLKGSNFDISRFNEAAASCSHTYFLAGSNHPAISDLSALIGTRSVQVVEAAIQGGLAEFLPEQPPQIEEGADIITPPEGRSIPVNYVGEFDQALINQISERLGLLLGALAWTIPLDRLDGITFADDYPAALASLDRGKFGIAQPQTRQDDFAVGIGQAPSVLRDGVLKSHVVVVGYVARLLMAEGADDQVWATGVLADLIAHAGVLQVIDETLPGILLNRRCEALEGDLQRCTYPGWNAYFSSRASAGFDENQLRQRQDILQLGLTDAFTEIPKARLEYRFHGDVRKMLDVVLPKIAFVLEYAANVAGVADGTDRDALADAPDLQAELETRELLAWFHDYCRDLIFLWDRRRKWKSYDEFLALNRHAERLLWCFAIVPWMTPDGDYRVEIPIQTDQEALSTFIVTQTSSEG